MSAQTRINPRAGSSHNALLGTAIAAAVAIIAAIALAVALLGSSAHPTAPAPRAFDAPAFRAEEHHLAVPLRFNANAFRAEERSYRVAPAVDANASREAEGEFINHNR